MYSVLVAGDREFKNSLFSFAMPKCINSYNAMLIAYENIYTKRIRDVAHVTFGVSNLITGENPSMCVKRLSDVIIHHTD